MVGVLRSVLFSSLSQRGDEFAVPSAFRTNDEFLERMKKALSPRLHREKGSIESVAGINRLRLFHL
jgi:hypothetical protein